MLLRNNRVVTILWILSFVQVNVTVSRGAEFKDTDNNFSSMSKMHPVKQVDGETVSGVAVQEFTDGDGQNNSEKQREDEFIIIGDVSSFEDLEIEEFSTVIESERPLKTGAQKKIGQQKIHRIHPATADDVLALVPGMVIVQHGSEGKGHQLFLRGFDAAHGSDVEVLMNGIPLNESSHVHGQGYVDLYGIIPETIYHVNVYKGPFLPKQGNFATAGTIDFDLRVPLKLRPGLVTYNIDQYGRQRSAVVVAPKELEEQSFVAFEVVDDPGFMVNHEGRRAAGILSYQKEFKNGVTFRALLNGQTARFDVPAPQPYDQNNLGQPEFYDSPENSSGSGLSDRLLLHTLFQIERKKDVLKTDVYGAIRSYELESNYTGWLHNPLEGDRKKQYQQGVTAGAIVFYERRFAQAKVPLTFQAEVGSRFEGGTQNVKTVHVKEHDDHNLLNLEFKTNLIYAYGKLQFSPIKQFEIIPSVRLDAFVLNATNRLTSQTNTKALKNISPRIAFVFPVAPKWRLFLDYGRGFRTPNAGSVLTRENENTSNEVYTGGTATFSVCDAVEGGIHFNHKGIFDAKVVGFVTWLKNEIVFSHISGINLEKNSSRRSGAEIDVTLTPFAWLSMDMQTTIIDARFIDSKGKIPGTSNLIIQGDVFIGKEEGPGIGVQSLYLSKRYLAHGARANGYMVMNVTTRYRFKHFEVNFNIENMLNTQFMEGVYHYASHFKRNQLSSAIPKTHYAAGAPFRAQLIFTAYF